MNGKLAKKSTKTKMYPEGDSHMPQDELDRFKMSSERLKYFVSHL